MTPLDLDKLRHALGPFFDALAVNEGDTLSSCLYDKYVLWTATGSWSHPVDITLGDLRRLCAAAIELAPVEVSIACPACGKHQLDAVHRQHLCYGCGHRWATPPTEEPT